MRTSSFRIPLVIPLIAGLLAGCNLPAANAVPATPDVTMAYQTVEARLTQNASLTPVATATLAPTATAPLAPSPTAGKPLPTPTQRPAAQPTQAVNICDQASPGVPIDVTIPDDTRMTPGQTFTKTWRLVNSGTCPWTTDYTLALFSGEPMGAPATTRLSKAVAPGESVDISVDLIAPASAGSYQGNWKLRNTQGAWFGIGPNGTSPFWVRIEVAGTAVATVTVTTTPGTPYPPGDGDPVVLVSGRNSMIPGDNLNLDTNGINTGAGEDLSLIKKDNNKLQLAPLGSAIFYIHGRGTPDFDTCSSAAMSSSVMKLENLGQGQYICYRTDQGLYGYLRLLGLDESSGTSTLAIQILTWAQP